jgi:hypothetical protein
MKKKKQWKSEVDQIGNRENSFISVCFHRPLLCAAVTFMRHIEVITPMLLGHPKLNVKSDRHFRPFSQHLITKIQYLSQIGEFVFRELLNFDTQASVSSIHVRTLKYYAEAFTIIKTPAINHTQATKSYFLCCLYARLGIVSLSKKL